MRELLQFPTDIFISPTLFSEKPATLNCKEARIPINACPCWKTNGEIDVLELKTDVSFFALSKN